MRMVPASTKIGDQQKGMKQVDGRGRAGQVEDGGGERKRHLTNTSPVKALTSLTTGRPIRYKT